MRFAKMALDGSNYVAAAQGANSGLQGILAKTTPDHAGLANLSLRNDAKDRIAAMNAMANLQNSSINSVVNTHMGKYNAEATKARGDANAAASMSAGIGNMASGLGTGIVNRIGKMNSKSDGPFTPGGSLDTFGGYQSIYTNDIGLFGGSTSGLFDPEFAFSDKYKSSF